MNKKKMAAVSLLTFALVSCAYEEFNSPYVLTKLSCTAGKREEYYAFSGINFTLFNATRHDIKKIDVSCLAYDSEGKNPFVGSNTILASCEGVLSSQDFKEYVISLDEKLSYVPEIPFMIDFFCVRRIVFANGEVWEDKNMTFYSRTKQ